jgi:transcriptional regulator with GAF, ATPase, and Fis domain
MILCSGPELTVELPSIPGPPAATAKPSSLLLEDVERQHILAVLEQTGWRVSGRQGAAELLGLKPTTLESRMARLGIRREKS